MLAGIAIGAGLAVVMRVIEQLSPTSAANCGVRCGRGITDNVLLVVLIGLIIGLGLGMGFAAAVPDRIARVDRLQGLDRTARQRSRYCWKCQSLRGGRAPAAA
jgi:hypothetical protein